MPQRCRTRASRLDTGRAEGAPERSPSGSSGVAPSSRMRAAAMLSALALAAVLIALAVGEGGGGPAGTSDAPSISARAPGTVASASRTPAPLTTSTAGGAELDPSRFAEGACVAFAPAGRGNRHTVFIDAGHGGIDPGGKGTTDAGQTIYEAGENLTIELQTMNVLRKDGFRVVVSRTSNTNVLRPTAADLTSGSLSVTGARADIAARDACADLAKATILVGIYFDAGTSPQNAGSITAYDPARPFAAKSEHLAMLLQRDVLAHLNANGWQIPDDGVQPDTTLGGLPLTTTAATYRHLILLGPAVPGWFTTPSAMPGALIEPLFLSDPFEGSIANSSQGHRAITEGMVQAIEQYLAPSPR